MYAIHNKNEWIDHKKETIRPSFEKIKLEIFSFEHSLTQRFHPTKNNIKGSNFKKVNHRSLKCLQSEDNTTSFTMEFDFNIKEVGEYRFDILYENRNAKDYIGEYDLSLKSEKSSKLYANTANVMVYADKLKQLNAKVKTVKEAINKAKAEYKQEDEKKNKDKEKVESKKKIVAKYESQLSKLNKKVEKYQSKLETTHKMAGTELSFEGELNITKRKTLFHNLERLGKYRLSLELPVNCYFIGLLVRKIRYYSGDNLDSVGTNLMFTDATITKSGEVKPAEASFELGFSDEFLCPLTYTGMYFNYGDEVNIYVKENSLESNTKMVRRFGGYLSTVQKSNDKKTVTFSCADRLIDGESKFILDSLLIQKGTTSKSEMEYNKPINFNNYGQALKYLCDIHEITLKSNIKKNYLVAGEKYSTGLALKFGKKKDIKDPKKVKAKNATVKFHNKFITVRNGKSGLKQQSIMLYDAKEYAKTPRPLKKVNSNGETTTNHLSFHLTYGLGDPAKSSDKTSTDQTSSDGSTGNYGKCGQSADKKTVMSIAKPSSGRNEGLSESQWYKVVFKNWCPYCKQSNLVYDSGTSKTNCVTCSSYTGSKRTWGDISEGEVTCNTEDCCADFCGATGWEKDGGFSSRLVTVVKPVKSSEAERDKLLDGKMTGAGAVKVTAENIFKEITKEAFKYRYVLGSDGQTWAEMKKIGYGDCFGFSDLIYKMMTKFGVKCKIVEYAATGGASNHHSVMYMNKKGNWVDFPYRELGWNTRYNNQLNNTAGSSSGQIIAINNAGKSIDQAKGTISSTSTTTTKVTTTVGYAKDNPFQAYIELTYSTEKSWKAKKKKININFTQKAGTNNDISGLPSYWINNAQRQVSVDLKGWFEDNEPKKSIYLHSIRLVTPPISSNSDTTTASDNKKEWYSFNKSTKDYASCKMDLYQIIFDDKLIINPTDLQSCGKTVNAMMEEIVEASGYRVHINYGKHRCDDKIIFSVDNQTKPLFTATEGDDNNILEWSNISCSPVTVVRNTSVCVYKDAKGKYQYVDTRNINSMLEYGEQTTLQTNSEVSGSKEAYFLARNSKEFNPEFDYTYTIVIPYAPNLQLKDIVEVIANNKFLNDIKPIESLQIKYDNGTKPTIQTTLGLGEIEPYLRIKQDMQKLRTANKKKSTHFSGTATPIDDEEIYAWDQ